MISPTTQTSWKRQANGSYREPSGRFELCPMMGTHTGRSGSGDALGAHPYVKAWEIVDLTQDAPNASWNGRPLVSYGTLREAKAGAERRLS